MPDDIICLLYVMRSINVGHQKAVVPCLIPDREQVSILPDQVGDAGILQAVEFPFRREFQSFPDIVAPVVCEDFRRSSGIAWPEAITEEVRVTLMREDVQLDHQFHNSIRQGDICSFAIFGAIIRDIDCASLNGDVM